MISKPRKSDFRSWHISDIPRCSTWVRHALAGSTDQAIAACDGNARDAVRALIVANEFLETEVRELMQAVSHAYVRGRFKAYTG
jgi:hypothetical protein